ncbi:hypothetical protein HOLleu_26069 [Holothuria leucospilota]|uniref:Uncharacterized protein n=1 Tax=Holothuria leucospilota TaxID=206669 RepID=A0A9Q1H4F6_HOLLE|nr:hypothetical protein HOLleu_26069 [Holothuria leucospilota]
MADVVESYSYEDEDEQKLLKNIPPGGVFVPLVWLRACIPQSPSPSFLPSCKHMSIYSHGAISHRSSILLYIVTTAHCRMHSLDIAYDTSL